MRAQEYFAAANLPWPAESGAATRRLCIVSRNPVVSGVLVAGLTASVGTRDELEIVVDRRRGPAPHPVLIERRHRDHVDRALEREGFAFVPTAPPDAANGALNGQDAWPAERIPVEETDERKLERILWLKHGRIIRLGRLLILSGLLNAILILFFVAPAVKARLTQARAATSAPPVVAPAAKAGESSPHPVR
jgi:hypothetical protein